MNDTRLNEIAPLSPPLVISIFITFAGLVFALKNVLKLNTIIIVM